MSADILASVSKTERKRQEAIFELLSSERNYVDSLKVVREVSKTGTATITYTYRKPPYLPHAHAQQG